MPPVTVRDRDGLLCFSSVLLQREMRVRSAEIRFQPMANPLCAAFKSGVAAFFIAFEFCCNTDYTILFPVLQGVFEILSVISPHISSCKNSGKLKNLKKPLDKRMKLCYTDIVIGNAKSSRQLCWCGSMAEQLICNQQVDGSTPFTSSIWGISRVAKGDRL